MLSRKLINKKDHILIALSGGVDSMVLAHLLVQLKSELELKLSAMHVQHHLREDAEKDAQLVNSFCIQLEIDHLRADLDPGLNPRNRSVEAWAREQRYRHLKRGKEQVKANKIVTAHHGDDQVETILMHIADSSGLDGLRGIREKYGDIYRPLLVFSKKDLEEYAQTMKVPFREDISNQDTDFPRNYLRKQVIAIWKKNTPFLTKAIQHVTDHVNETADTLEYMFKQTVQQFVTHDERGRLIIHLNRFAAAPMSFLAQLIHYLVGNDLPWRRYQWQSVKRLIEQGRTGSVLRINDKTILKDREKLIIEAIKTTHYDQYIVHENEKIKTDDFIFSWTQTTSRKSYSPNRYLEFVDADKLGSELVLRIWENEDQIQPLGMTGHKKMSDFLIDAKVDLLTKRRQVVLADEHEVYWVCGRQISDAIKVTDKTTHFAKLSYQPVVG